jgi:hypothetical protein
MPSGITGASITTLTNGTTASAADVMASLNSLKSNGVNNDSGTITTDNSGGITAVKFSTANGQIRGIFFLGSFFQLTTNPTVNSGVTSALTASGGATGVPSAAIAVLISGSITSATVGAYVTVAAHSASMTGVPQIGTIQVTNQFAAFGNLIVPLASNQIDVKANTGNCILQTWYINGYII